MSTPNELGIYEMRVYVHGNCQASAVGWLIEEAKYDVKVKSREVHSFDLASAEEFEAYRADVECADLILMQPISDDYRNVDYLSTNWINHNKKKSTKILVFPSIHFRAYNIQSFALGIHGHIMDYHDVHVADMYRLGLSSEECHERISAKTFFSKEFVLNESLLCLREIIRREHACDADALVSPVLATYLDQELLFHTFNHPARRVLVSVTNQLLRAAGESILIPIEGTSYLNNTRIMPYHATVQHLGLSEAAVAELGQMVRLHTNETLLAYVQAAYESYDQVGHETVSLALLQHAEANSYLNRFQESNIFHNHEFRAIAYIRGLFQILLKRHPSNLEVQYWVQSLSRIGQINVMHQFMISDEYQALQNNIPPLK